MAVGLGRMLGFEFLPNFNYPYISKSVTEFWRRWHISLSTWFREGDSAKAEHDLEVAPQLAQVLNGEDGPADHDQ